MGPLPAGIAASTAAFAALTFSAAGLRYAFSGRLSSSLLCWLGEKE